MKVRLYFDSDGCLAKWDPNASIEDTFKEGFFTTREPQLNLMDAMCWFDSARGIGEVLSAAYQEGTAIKEKTDWFEWWCPSIKVNLVPYGVPKSSYINKEECNILIDDFTRNLVEWEEASPYNFSIKFYNEVNGTNGKWAAREGMALYHDMTSAAMINTLETMVTCCLFVATMVDALHYEDDQGVLMSNSDLQAAVEAFCIEHPEWDESMLLDEIRNRFDRSLKEGEAA